MEKKFPIIYQVFQNYRKKKTKNLIPKNQFQSHFPIHSCFTFMKYFARATISVFKRLKPTFHIQVKPNANNQILVPIDSSNQKEKNAMESEKQPIQCFACFGNCTRMDKKIMKLAFAVLEKIRMEKYEEDDKDLLKERICNIEVSLENIANKLNTLLNTK